MAEMPSWLVQAVEARLERRSRGELSERSSRISQAYRGGGASKTVVREAGDALAYAVARMPATFAAAGRVFEEIEALLPDFAPASICDAGAGPGTAGFAALSLWPSLKSLRQLDHNDAFLSLAADFARSGGAAQAFELAQTRCELAALPLDLSRFDLTILCYVLAEFDRAKGADIAAGLWERTDGLLAVIEPGTPEGYARIIAARDRLLAEGAHILAPCPHAAPCPLQAPDWCHFAERLPRRRAHMAAKGAALPFEDEKFAYLVAARPEVGKPLPEARIITPPDANKAGIRFTLCRPDGTAGPEVVPKRDKARFAGARRLGWGDRLAEGASPGAPDRADTL